jgi:hypothetical protein
MGQVVLLIGEPGLGKSRLALSLPCPRRNQSRKNHVGDMGVTQKLRLLSDFDGYAVATPPLTGWRTVSGNENRASRVAERALARVPAGGRCVLTVSSVNHNQTRTPIRVGANGLGAPRPGAAPVLSIDELRSVVFIIRCARAIAFLQRFVPERYLPPKDDRVPPSLLKRLIHELKKLIPKWKWTSSARELPRSPAKLGDELFYAITALRMSRLEIWRAGYTDCVAVLDEAYELLYALGIRMRERKHRSKGQQVDVTQ